MFSVGPATFHLYGLMIGLGILAGVWVSSRVAKTVQMKKEIGNVLWWVLAGGILGARLYHVIDLWGYYRLNPLEILAVWNGGMGIFGAIAGGAVGAWLYDKIMLRSQQKFGKKRFGLMLDLAGVGLPLGQAIGRLGNWFNQELYGLPTDLPWGIYIRPENRLDQVRQFEQFHPLFLYEIIWNLLVFGLMYRLVKRKKIKLGSGGVFVGYLGLYGLGRFFLEFLRLGSWTIYGVNVAQAISVGLVIGAVIYWIP